VQKKLKRSREEDIRVNAPNIKGKDIRVNAPNINKHGKL